MGSCYEGLVKLVVKEQFLRLAAILDSLARDDVHLCAAAVGTFSCFPPQSQYFEVAAAMCFVCCLVRYSGQEASGAEPNEEWDWFLPVLVRGYGCPTAAPRLGYHPYQSAGSSWGWGSTL